jgi:hypothetical protein
MDDPVVKKLVREQLRKRILAYVQAVRGESYDSASVKADKLQFGVNLMLEALYEILGVN